MRTYRSLLVVALAAAGGLGLFAPSNAMAGCIGPSISLADAVGRTTVVGGEQVPVYSVAPADLLTVDGEYFFVGCNDAIQSEHGCSAPADRPPAPAARDVPLILTQAGRHWTLGTADAAGEDASWAITWTAELPPDVAAGAAVVTADTAELHLVIGLPGN